MGNCGINILQNQGVKRHRGMHKQRWGLGEMCADMQCNHRGSSTFHTLLSILRKIIRLRFPDVAEIYLDYFAWHYFFPPLSNQFKVAAMSRNSRSLNDVVGYIKPDLSNVAEADERW